MMSFMQSRLGPMEAGPYGSLAARCRGRRGCSEDTAPRGADHRIFKMAPLIALVSTFLLVAAVPFGPDAWLTDFQVGVFCLRRVVDQRAAILVAGWSSANKYSLLGGLRGAGQLIAYELPLVLGAIGVVIQAGSMNFHHRPTERRRHLRLGRPRQPLRADPVRRLRRVHDRRAG